MAKRLAVVAALAGATAVGTALTVGTYSAVWGTPDGLLHVSAAVAVFHLLLCGTYVVMSESVIEDAVKSCLFTACGGVLCAGRPLLGLVAISAAVMAFVTNQSLQRVERKSRNGPGDDS